VRRRLMRILVGLSLLLAYGLMTSSAFATAPSNQGLPWVSGSFASGQVLSVSEGDWLGSQPLTAAYQWQRCSSYRDVVLGDSAVAFWRLGEAQGASSAVDEGSSPVAGTFSNVPTLAQAGPLSGDPNRAVRFDGAGAFVDVADAAKLKPASAVTLEAWVKTTASNGVIVDKPYTAGALVSYSLSVAAGKAKVAIDLSGGHSYSLSSTASINDGQWHYLVGTFGSASLKLYVDGASAGNSVGTTGSLQYSTLKLQIGRFDSAGGNYLAGVVDEVAVYSSALSSTLVSAHYNAGVTANGVDAHCTNISGATASFYTPGSSDLGKRLRANVTATNGEGSASASSYATVIVAAAPASLDAPDLSGTAKEGQTLAAGSGAWSGATPISYAYQWQRCSAYVAAVAADVPAGYWRLGEVSGWAVADAAGENGGTYVGSPTLGLVGALARDANTAVDFDGLTQQLTLSQDVSFGSGNFTIEAWFKTTAGGTIWRSGDSGTGRAYADLALSGGKLRGTVKGSSTLTLTSPSSYQDGAWHQGVFTRSGSSFTLYADGASVATASGSVGDLDGGAAATIIGATSSGSWFGGVLDEVAAYKTALSSTRVLAHYNARSAPCTNVGSNSSTYTLVTADVGASAVVTVTGSNSAGSAAAASAPVFVVAKTKPASVNPPMISGSPVVGQSVTGSPGSWDQSASFTYQWRRCTPFASVVAADRPLAYWRLGERDPSKTDAIDNVGSRKGVYVGGPVYGYAGALGHDPDTAVYLNGEGKEVTIADEPQFNAGDFTIEGWFRSSQSSGRYQLWYSGKGSGSRNVGVALVDGKLEATADDGSNSTVITSSSGGYANDAWQHFAFTRAGTSFKLYADATQVASSTKTLGDVDHGDGVIGALDNTSDSNPATNEFQGAIDEVAVYTHALSSTQISAHRSSGLDPCADLGGQTQSTYTVVSADAGKFLLVKVGGTNSAGTSYAGSPLTFAAAAGSPVNITAPKITGRVAIGSQLSASSGGWIGTPTISYAYQWQRCDGYPVSMMPAPLHWYRLDDLPGSGTVDATGSSSAGSYAGTPRYGSPGALAYEPSTSISFNTSDEDNPDDQYATLPTVQLDTGNFTVEGWYKQTDSSGPDQGIWMSGSGNTLSQYVSLTANGATVKGKATDGTNSIDLGGSGTGSDSDWHHAAFTRSGTTFTLYVDGLQVATGTHAMGDVDAAGKSAYIGRSADGSGLFKGSLDEVAVYTSALSVTRIQAHAKNNYSNCTNISGATGQNYTATAADRGYRLNVKVTATNGSGSTDKLSEQTVTLWDAAPALDIPVDQGVARSVTPTLKMNPLSGTGNKYSLELAETDTFEKIIAASGWQPDTTTWAVPSDAELKDGNGYVWRARALTSTGTTTLWSEPRKLQIKVKRFGIRDYWPIWKAGPVAVNEATGNLILTVPGPSYPSVVGALSLAVMYNSLDTGDQGLGDGWTLAAGSAPPVKLVDHSQAFDSAEIVWLDGSSDYFNHIGGSSSGIYQAPPGSSMQLTKNRDHTWTLADNQGSIYSFATANSGGTAKLTAAEITAAAPDKAKLIYTFDDNPLRLTRVADQAGRTLNLDWSCANALLCVTGPDNAIWKYIGNGTGGTGGKLAKVNDGTRDLLQLTYGSNGRPSELRNANDLDPSHASPGYDSSHKVAVGYDSNNLVTSVSENHISTQTPSTSTWSFAYHSGPVFADAPAKNHDDGAVQGVARTADGYTEITPPGQQGAQKPKKLKVYYDGLDHPIETVNVLGYYKLTSYNTKDQLEWSEDEDGNPTDNTWDPVTDLLTQTQAPDPDGTGGLDRPITKYRYDELTIGDADAPGLELHGLHAAYFTNANLSGRPVVEQTDPQVDFNWGTGGAPALDYRSDNFSIRWTGTLNVNEEGDYTFSTYSEGGTTLVVDQTRAIDGVDQQNLAIGDTDQHSTATVSSQPIGLKPGAHNLVLEYAETTGAAEIHLRYSCATCSPQLSDQVVPSSAFMPNWGNQTSVVAPTSDTGSGRRISFSHYADPAKQLADYWEQKLEDGTPVITSFAHDSYGRATQKVMPKGNASRMIDGLGNLQGAIDNRYTTTWTYYAPGETAAPPNGCGGSAVDQALLLKSETPYGIAATTTVYDSAGRAIADTNGRGTTATHTTAKAGS
jgi:hypothetical protein